MRIFTVDRGNSNTSYLMWNDDSFQLVEKITEENIPVIASNVSAHKFSSPIIEFNHLDQFSHLLPFQIEYPNTIGVDRIFCAISAFLKKSENQNILIIDAGTFTTVDLLIGNNFKGGMILPGDNAIQNCYQIGANLSTPLFSTESTLTYPFNTTQSCLTSSFPFLLKTTYEKIIKENSIDQVFFTGGNGQIHQNLFQKIDVKTQYEPFLIHFGIKYIFNKNKTQTQGRQ